MEWLTILGASDVDSGDKLGSEGMGGLHRGDFASPFDLCAVAENGHPVIVKSCDPFHAVRKRDEDVLVGGALELLRCLRLAG